LVIGAIAAVVIGVAAYVLPQPRAGSVEYHKKKYLEEQKRVAHPWVEQFAVPAFAREFYYERHDKRRKFHQRALINDGYLAETMVKGAGLLPPGESTALSVAVSNDPVTLAFVSIEVHSTNATVIAPRTVIDQVAEVVRDAHPMLSR
jgi:hypothetical protein